MKTVLNKTLKNSLIALLLLALGACATTDYSRNTPPAPIEEKIVIDGSVMPLPEQNGYQVEALSAEPRVSPVVSQLLVKAEQHRQNQNWEAAANALERALRIEPRNPILWNRLADVRYSQKDWQQAVQLAAKSNTLVRTNKTVRRQNWYLMVNAYDAMGNQQASEKYKAKLQAN